LAIDEGALVRALVVPVADGRLAKRAGWYATPGHQPRLSPDQERLFADLIPTVPDAPLVPVAFSPLALEVRRSKVTGAQAAFDAQLGIGGLVRVGDHVYRAAQIGAIRERLERALAGGGRITAAAFRDLVGTSRKYAVPLLEYFDHAGITAREGDERVLTSLRPR
jgi:selenocysteine-specific elongation factor